MIILSHLVQTSCFCYVVNKSLLSLNILLVFCFVEITSAWVRFPNPNCHSNFNCTFCFKPIRPGLKTSDVAKTIL